MRSDFTEGPPVPDGAPGIRGGRRAGQASSGRRRRAQTLVAATVSALVAGSVTTLATSLPSATAATIPDECQTSPFGNSATWAGRNSIFVDGITVNPAPTLQGNYWSKRSYQLATSGSAINYSGVTPTSEPTRAMLDTASVAADIDGDGTKEIIRASTVNSGGVTEVTSYRHDLATKRQSPGPTVMMPNRYVDVVLAAGRFTKLAESTLVPAEQVAVVGRLAGGSVEITVLRGATAGEAWGLQPVSKAVTSHTVFNSGSGAFGVAGGYQFDAKASLLDAATGDGDGDGYLDLYVAYQNSRAGGTRLGVLLDMVGRAPQGGIITPGQYYKEYPVPADMSASGPTSLPATSWPHHLRLAVGDYDGDFVDDVTVAWDGNDSSQPVAIVLATLKVTLTGTVPPWTRIGQRVYTEHQSSDFWAPSWDIATGDFDNDRHRELLLAAVKAPNEIKVSLLGGKATGLPTLKTASVTAVGTGTTLPSPQYLAMGVGDQNLDARHDAAISFVGVDGMQRTNVLAQLPGGEALTRMAQRTEFVADRPKDVMVTDWDNSSARTIYTEPPGQARCVTITVPTLVSAIDSAPYWSKIMSPGTTGMGSGRETEQEATQTHTEKYTDTEELKYSTEGGAEFSIPLPVIENIKIGVTEKHEVSEKYQWENGLERKYGTTQREAVSTGWHQNQPGRSVEYDSVPYRCYYFRLWTGNWQNAWQTLCTVLGVNDTNKGKGVDSETWNDRFGPVGSTGDRAWVPIRPEWTNLVLQQKATNITASSSATSPALAGDGDPETTNPASAWRSVNQANPWWQVDLGRQTALDSVSVYPESLVCQSVCNANPDYPRDVRVYVFDDASLADDASLDGKPGVRSFGWAGYLFGRTNYQTRLKADPATGVNAMDPARGRFVRVQRLGTGTLRLSEVQVYPDQRYVDPTQFPAKVEQIQQGLNQVRHDYFKAWVWVEAERSYKTIKVAGDLLYGGDQYMVHAAHGAGSDWDLLKGQATSDGKAITQESGYETSRSSGAEVSAQAWFMSAKVGIETGATKGFAAGTEQESSRSVGTSFRMWGWYDGLEVTDLHADNTCPPYGVKPPGCWEPANYEAPEKCEFTFNPFYYRAHTRTNDGLLHNYLTVSYVVKEEVLPRTADLSNCRDGIRRRRAVNTQPVVQPISASTTQDQFATIDVLGKASDPDDPDIAVGMGSVPGDEILRIAGVGVSMAGSTPAAEVTTARGAKVKVDGSNVVYTPAVGFTGTDEFYVVVTDGDRLSEPAKVTVSVQPPSPPLSNGGFENCLQAYCSWGAQIAPWSFSNVSGIVWGQLSPATGTHSGTALARLDVTGFGSGVTMSQSFSIPNVSAPKLTVWHRKGSVAGSDVAQIKVTDGVTTQTLKTLTAADATGWLSSVLDVSAFKGRNVTLQVMTSGPNDGVASVWWFDDISVS